MFKIIIITNYYSIYSYEITQTMHRIMIRFFRIELIKLPVTIFPKDFAILSPNRLKEKVVKLILRESI